MRDTRTRFLLVLITIALAISGAQLAIGVDVPVSGGTLKDFSGRDVLRTDNQLGADFGPNGFRPYRANGANTLYLDMGSNRWVKSVIVLNRNVGTALQFGSSHIYAAVDETASGFDPASLAGYTLDIHTTASPAPNTIDASVLRTCTLSRPVYRRYLRYDLLGNYGGAFPRPNPADDIGDAGDLDVAGTALTKPVAAGTLNAMAGNDTLYMGAEIGLLPSDLLAANGDGDSVIRLLLDLGSRKGVKTLIVTNRSDANTNYAIKDITAKTAPNEGQASFDPQIYTNYTTTIGSGNVMPVVNTAAAQRTLNLTLTRCRYLMIEITKNQVELVDAVQFGNIAVETYITGTVVAIQ